jgi:hypothetical protein
MIIPFPITTGASLPEICLPDWDTVSLSSKSIGMSATADFTASHRATADQVTAYRKIFPNLEINLGC